MIANWVIQVIIAVVLQVTSLLLMPRPQTARPDSARDFEAPTADAGRPQPVVVGTVRVKGLNVLGAWDKSSYPYQVSV